MFTILTIGATWFAFGYCFTDLLLTIIKNHQNGKYDE